MKPPLLLIDGAPGAGKSALAAVLCPRLHLPLIAKDPVKEALADALETRTLDESYALGSATFAVMYALAGAQVDLGIGAVIEAPFNVAGCELRSLLARSKAAAICCEADTETLLARYRRRAGTRHTVHFDSERLASGWQPTSSGGATAGLPIPRLLVRTEHGYDPEVEAVLSWTQQRLGLEPGS